MVRAALVFFIIAFIAFFLGAAGVAGMSMDAAKTLLWVFVVMALVTLGLAMVTGNRSIKPNKGGKHV